MTTEESVIEETLNDDDRRFISAYDFFFNNVWDEIHLHIYPESTIAKNETNNIYLFNHILAFDALLQMV